MSDNFAICDDDSNDGSLLDSSVAGTAVLEPGDGADAGIAEWTGARCEKCEARLVSDVVSICRHCGWYASLGQFVEVDPEWEIDLEPEAAAEAEAAPRPSHLQVWLGLLPRWSWVIIASVLFLAMESVVVRFVTPADSWIRTTWSLSQLTIGLLAAFGCHIFNFLIIVGDDAEVGLLDLLLKPLKLWGRSIQNLPLRLWVVNAAVSGLAAAALSLLVIGGIPYDRLWDWGVKQPPKQDLMAAVMNQVQKLDDGKGSDDLEKSIGDFAGKKGDELTDKPKVDPPKPQQNADCVILGYVLDRDGRVAMLVLGTASSGQLVYAGNVAPKLADDEMKGLAESLKSIESGRPIIRIEYEATWVQPKYTCRVSFGQRTKSGRLHDIEWSKLLGSIEKR
jgi:hypothetical protein